MDGIIIITILVYSVWGGLFGFDPMLTFVFGSANLLLTLFGAMVLSALTKGRIWK